MTAYVDADYLPIVEIDQRDEATERRLSLQKRRVELAARLIRLRSEDAHYAEGLERAKWWAAAALRHETNAHLRAAVAHRGVAAAHRQAAEQADRVGQHARADRHRATAKTHDEEAEAHTRAAVALRDASQDQ